MSKIKNLIKTYDWLDISFWLAVFILAFFFGCSVGGCTTQSKVQNWNNKHPELAAQYCADKFPAKDSVSIKEVFLPGDSAEYLKSIDDLNQSVNALNEINDSLIRVLVADTACNKYLFTIRSLQRENTILRQKIAAIKCPKDTIRKDSIIYRRDRAQEFVLETQINALQQDTSKLKAQVAGLKGKVSSKNKHIWWLIIALALSVAWNFRKIIARLIVPIIPPIS
jgi:hypothetical protein